MGMFDDLFDGESGGLGIPSEEKGLPWRAKKIDGKLYLPLEQVVELLKQNDVLPKVRAGLEKHLS